MPGLVLPGRDCPCGSGRTTADCCGRVHADHAAAGTAEQLMRARYSAYALGVDGFLRRSWAPETRPPTLDLDGGPTWTGLEIVDVVAGAPGDETGIVEFRARYEAGGRPGVQHERSRFRRHDGRWVYVDAAG